MLSPLVDSSLGKETEEQLRIGAVVYKFSQHTGKLGVPFDLFLSMVR